MSASSGDVPLLTPSRVSALLRERGLRPRQALGQNFLADPNTVRRIVSLAGVSEGDRVLEIGPGLGSLTLGLVDSGAHVVAVEADARLADACRSLVPEATVVTGDALRLPLPDLLDDGPWSSVSNLPYNVAVPVIMRLLDECAQVARLFVMVQSEVGARLVAGPGDDARGAVSVKVEYHATSRVEGRVPPTVFIPAPAVDSVLVSLVRRTSPVTVDRAALFRVVSAAFGHRRKTLRRGLRELAGSAGAASAALNAAGIDPQARAEELSLSSFADLTAALGTAR